MRAPALPDTKRPKRLSPDQRREQLLECASQLIVEHGLSRCSLEEIAGQAGVSKALVYKYFATRDELLKALVQREYNMLLSSCDWTRPELTLGQMIRRASRESFDYLYERGPILREILSDGPTGRALGRGDREERERRTRYFSDKVVETYGVSPQVALLGTLIAINVPSVAFGGLKRNGFTPEQDFWSAFVLGGWAACSARFGPRESLSDPAAAPSSARPKIELVIGSKDSR